MPASGIHAALEYVSRRWRGLWPALDEVQDLIEAPKRGERRAAAVCAAELAKILK